MSRMRLAILHIIVFMMSLAIAQAQMYVGAKANSVVAGSDKVKISSTTQAPSYIRFADKGVPFQYPEKQKVSHLRKVLELPSGYNLKSQTIETDAQGTEHHRYQLTLNNIPVEGLNVSTHAANGLLKSVTGHYYRKTAALQSATITPQQAIAMAEQELMGSDADDSQLKQATPMPEMVYLFVDNSPVLCYKTDVYLQKPLQREYVYVSAHTGKIVKRTSRIFDADMNGTAQTLYSGIQPITSEYYLGSYRLRETGRGNGIRTYNLRNSFDYGSAIDFMDADNNWDAQSDRQAFEAHWGAEVTYDFLLNRFGRTSIDNKGLALESYVHYGSNYCNAFWDGERMTYGDGDGTRCKPFTSLDVIAHEIAHGLTTYTANLDYQNESGALNEGFSDIFAVAIDFWANPLNANYQIGEQIKVDGSAFRNIANPNEYGLPDTYKGTNWYTGTNDFGGVHTNSAVLSYWFYLLSNGGNGSNDMGNSYSVSAISMNDAIDIAYRALAYYLTSYSTFDDARFYTIQAATDLFGACSTQLIAVTNAWHAVGVGQPFNNTVTAAFSVDHQFSCASPVTFQLIDKSTNATTYQWRKNGHVFSTEASPSLFISSSGSYTISLTVTGTETCNGTDTHEEVNYLRVEDNDNVPVTSSTPSSLTPGETSLLSASINNHIINNSALQLGYLNYTCHEQVILTEGGECTLSATTATPKSAIAYFWLDLNNDGQFDGGKELIGSFKTSSAGNSYQLTVPTTSFKNRPLRLRIGTDADSYTLNNGIGTSHTGQFIDVTAFVQANTSAPVAAFSSSSASIYPGGSIDFSDMSTNLPTSFQWTFSGGTPATSTLANPTVTYNSNGIYDVELTVANSFGTHTVTKTGYITVSNSYNMGQQAETSSNTGTIYDSGGATGVYKGSESTSFLIAPTCVEDIALTIETLQTESGFDFLYVYNGSDATAPLLGSYSGTLSTSTVLHATSGKLFLQFISDGSVNLNGFKATWTSTPKPDSAPTVAAFTASKTNPAVNETVVLTDNSSNDPYEWHWNLGDGTTSRQSEVTHSYQAPGVYQVTLKAINCGSQATISSNIQVQAYPKMSLSASEISSSLMSGETETLAITISNEPAAGDLLFATSIDNLYYSPSAAISHSVFPDSLKQYQGNYADNGATISYSVTNRVIHSVSLASKKVLIPTTQTDFYNLLIDDLTARGAEVTFTATPSESTINQADVILVDDNCNALNSSTVQAFLQNGGTLIIAGDENLSSYNNYLQNSSLSMVNEPCTAGNCGYIATCQYTNDISQFEVSGNSLASIAITSQSQILLKDNTGLAFSAHALMGSGNIIVIADEIHAPTSYTLPGNAQLLYNIIGTIATGSNWLTVTPPADTLTAGYSSDLQVIINASNLLEGTYHGDIFITSNSETKKTAIPVTLNITGVPQLTVSKADVNFGSTMTSTSVRKNIIITNSGTALLTLSTQDINGQFIATPQSISLLPGEDFSFPIDFSPTNVGLQKDTLRMTSNDINTPIIKIALVGTGMLPPSASINPVAIKHALFSDEIDTLNILIDNSLGGSSLNITDIYLKNFTQQAAIFDTVKVSLQDISVAISAESVSKTNMTDFLSANNASITDLDLSINQDIIVLAEVSLTDAMIDSIRHAVYDHGKGLWIESYAASAQLNRLLDGTGIQFNNLSHNEIASPQIAKHQVTYNLNSYLAEESQASLRLSQNAVSVINTSNESSIAACTEFGKGRIMVAPSLNGYYLSHTGHKQLLMNGMRWLAGLNNWIWLSHYPTQPIAAGSHTEMQLILDANNLATGTYRSEVHFTTNDPSNLEVALPVELDVTAVPVFKKSCESIDFGTQFIGAQVLDSVMIQNSGSSIMTVKLTLSSSTNFSIQDAGLVLQPKEWRYIKVYFSPKATGTFTAQLMIETNARQNPNAVISLSGQATEAPQINVIQQSVNVSLTTNASATRLVNIQNLASVTDLSIDPIITSTTLNDGKVSLETVKSSLIAMYSQLTNLIPSYFEFSGGETGSSISDGGQDMFDNGNILSINNNVLNYTDGAILPESSLGTNGQYLTCKFPGLFVMAADINKAYAFSVTGGLGADGDGTADEAILSMQSNGHAFNGYVKRVYGAGDASVNHLIIVEDAGNQIHTTTTNTNSDYQEITGLSECQRIYYLLFATKNGSFVETQVFEQLMNTFVKGLWSSGINWVTIQESNHTIGASSTDNLQLNFNSNNLDAGLYEASLHLHTNDPLSPVVNVHLKMMVGNNQSPVLLSTIPDQTMSMTDKSLQLNLDTYFTDPDHDALSYSLCCSDNYTASGVINSGTLIITPEKAGTTTIYLTVSDGNGGENQASFILNVTDVATTVDTPKNLSITVAPNPVITQTQLFAPANLSYQLLDINSKLILNGLTQAKATPIDLSGLKSGIYILKVENHPTVKIVKQ